jgi:hypothetical protein
MKASKLILGLLILIIVTASAAYAQTTFTQTVTAVNKSCNQTCTVLDIPALNSNTLAVIFVTPVVVNGVNLNPHPIGAYYMYLNKWSVYNLDGVAMTIGAKFNVEYYVNPDSNHFSYVLPTRAHISDPAYIDRAGLNNNRNLAIRVFPLVTQYNGGILVNKLDVKVEYNATFAKWFIANLNSTPIPQNVAYNVMVSSIIVPSNVPAARDKTLQGPPKVPVPGSPKKPL